MKLALLNLLLCVVVLAPRSARAESARQCLGSAPSTSACRAARADTGTVLELTRGGPVVLFGNASLQIQVGATRLALALSLSL